MPLAEVCRRGLVLAFFSFLTISCSLLGSGNGGGADTEAVGSESAALDSTDSSTSELTRQFESAAGEEGSFDAAPVLGMPSGRRAKRMYARGDYLLNSVATCETCHATAKGSEQLSSLGGGRLMEDRFGEVYAANITPDSETGIGDWGIGEISRAIRASIDRDGKPLSIDVHHGYRWMSDYDANSISLYLLSQKAVSNAVPRRALGGFERRKWGMFTQHRDIIGYVPMPPEKLVPQYGQYLVFHVASCGRCHSPTDADDPDEVLTGKKDRGFTNIFVALRQFGGMFSDTFTLEESDRLEIEGMLSAEGAKVFRREFALRKAVKQKEAIPVKSAPSLRSSDSGSLAAWTIDDFVDYLSTGRGAGKASLKESQDVAGSCPWPHYSGMAESDKRAIAMFLKRL